MSGNDLMAVDLTTTPTLRAGVAHRLFSGDAVGTRLIIPEKIERFYGIAPDGKRFVVSRGDGMGKSDVVLAEGALTRGTPPDHD